MLTKNIPDLILQETKQLPDDLLKEVLDFVLFLKNKSNIKNLKKGEDELNALQQNELKHLEYEFENYKDLYPNE